ncbi:MAG: hypothetical protein ACJ73N_02445, partial [Bryobacteraceae bacterium]
VVASPNSSLRNQGNTTHKEYESCLHELYDEFEPRGIIGAGSNSQTRGPTLDRNRMDRFAIRPMA